MSRQVIAAAGGFAVGQVCQACPVQADCLDYAVRIGQRHGIWGGLSERERRRRVRSGRVAS